MNVIGIVIQSQWDSVVFGVKLLASKVGREVLAVT